MNYRVYDTEQCEWISDNIYMNPYGELFKIKQSLLGMLRVPLSLDLNRYICHRDIGLVDKYGNEVFEGDYIKAAISKNDNGEYKIEIGIVCYATELSSYIMVCGDSNTFYTLGTEICQYIEVVGNVFDGYKK